MKTVQFYTASDGKCPVADFLDSLPSKQAQKVVWVLPLVESVNVVPKTYLKKLLGTDGIWEVRIQSGNNIYRLLGFFDGDDLIVLNHGFQKKNAKNSSQCN
jgi:phage-related protein